MPASRIKAGQASGSLRKLMPQLVRCLTSAAAILGVDEVHDTFRALVPHIATFEQQAGTSFSDRVAEKRART